jgi:hypothetical protein
MGTEILHTDSSRIVDTPKTGALVWVMFLGFLIPPALVVFLASLYEPLPHQTLWVVLFGIPAFLLLFSLPRRYTLDLERLTIHGLFYRFHIPRQRIRSVRRVGAARAMASLSSIFCSDPRRALLIRRDRGLPVVISPSRPEPFLALDPSTKEADQ